MKRWLQNAEAAEALAVDVRTIKRWMRSAATQAALLAVQHGKQWRIPRPNNLDVWEFETRARLKTLGLTVKDAWERRLEQIGKECGRYYLESCRLWLAASAKAAEQEDISQEARDQILMLWQAANEILTPLPRHEMEVDKLRVDFLAALKSRGLRTQEIEAVMSRWPDERHFKLVRSAHTLDALETIRRALDYTQAVCELKRAQKKPTEQNLRALLHADITAHINDTREKLPSGVIDFRQPQDGLKRHTARKRYRKNSANQKKIVAAVYGIRDSLPGAGEKPSGKMTPKRGSRADMKD
jgi:hypothetical protein